MKTNIVKFRAPARKRRDPKQDAVDAVIDELVKLQQEIRLLTAMVNRTIPPSPTRYK